MGYWVVRVQGCQIIRISWCQDARELGYCDTGELGCHIRVLSARAMGYQGSGVLGYQSIRGKKGQAAGLPGEEVSGVTVPQVPW